jgi:hypothetical protein
MRRYLLTAALALTTVWATGCIIIDADRMESHRPATVRSEECVVQQNDAGTPAVEQAGHTPEIVVQQ